MPEPTLKQFRVRFIMHLTAALRGRMEFGGLPLTSKMADVHDRFCKPEVELPAARAAVEQIGQEWLKLQLQPDRPDGDVWQAVADALSNVIEVINQAILESDDPDAFIGAVFRCRDWIMGLDLLLRAQRGQS